MNLNQYFCNFIIFIFFFYSSSFDWKLQNTLNSITNMLSDWIPIVEEVLELTPEHILSQIDQGPNSEILFWQKRKDNLEYIYAQVRKI